MKPKTVSFIPTPQLEKNLEQLKKTLRTSKAGLAEIALDFVTSRLLQGKARVVNGSIELLDEPQKAA